MEQIFYLSATIFISGLPFCEGEQQGGSNAVGNFYIKADSGVLAGAIASDICSSRKILFRDYICLPVLVGEDFNSCCEHQFAYEEAKKNGSSILISMVMNSNFSTMSLDLLVE